MFEYFFTHFENFEVFFFNIFFLCAIERRSVEKLILTCSKIFFSSCISSFFRSVLKVNVDITTNDRSLVI